MPKPRAPKAGEVDGVANPGVDGVANPGVDGADPNAGVGAGVWNIASEYGLLPFRLFFRERSEIGGKNDEI